MPDYKLLFENLCVNVACAEHMGDAIRAVRNGLFSAGHDTAGLFNDYDEIQHQWFVDNGFANK